MKEKIEYWDIIKYGIDSVGREAKISDIEEIFKGRTRVVDDLDNMEVWATNHAYLGQEHLTLSFEQDNFYGLIDFDLMPNRNSLNPEAQIKRLVNFKAQIFGKKLLLWSVPLARPRLEVYSNLKGQYGLPNDFNKFDKEKKEEFIKAEQLLREQYGLFGQNQKEVHIWYIEKQGVYYLASFYYFQGKKEVPAYLSFAITEMFKFEEKEEEQIKKIKSVKAEKLSEELVNFVPKLVDLMENNKQKYGKYRPDDWQIKSFDDYASRYTFDIFDLIEEKKINDLEDFIKYYFEKEKEKGWGEEEHLRKHFEKIALATALEIRRRVEGDQIRKIQSAKTGVPIELTGCIVFDKEGNDTGKRFVRKEDAEECQKQLSLTETEKR